MGKSKQIFAELREKELIAESKKVSLPAFWVDEQLKEKYRHARNNEHISKDK